MSNSDDYSLLLKFIDTYLPSGFKEIHKETPLVQKICAMMVKYKQHFHIADMLQLKMLYVDPSIQAGLGISPNSYDPSVELELTHKNDAERYNLSRSRLLKLSAELYSNSESYALISTNLRFRHANGNYKQFLVQGYIFGSLDLRPSIYGLIIKTDIEWFGPIKNGFHFYFGSDLSNFRVPDKDLIKIGYSFTDREYKILKLIRIGLDSKQIGEKLFISAHTVDTHRRNILKKTGFHHCTELVMDLQEKGFL